MIDAILCLVSFIKRWFHGGGNYYDLFSTVELQATNPFGGFVVVQDGEVVLSILVRQFRRVYLPVQEPFDDSKRFKFLLCGDDAILHLFIDRYGIRRRLGVCGVEGGFGRVVALDRIFKRLINGVIDVLVQTSFDDGAKSLYGLLGGGSRQ